MKLFKSILLLILIPNLTFSQSEYKLKELYTYDTYINNKNFINEFKKYDFSRIWTETKEPAIVGIIGDNHQRIRIKIISVVKKSENNNEYIVYGKSKVKNNVCEFKGTIQIKRILKIKEVTHGIDDWYKDKIKEQGVLIATYYFEENKHKKGTGVFKGKVYTKWCILNDSKDKISYDNIEEHRNGFKNNSFVGTWKSYRTKKKKICNWGDWRVPFANSDFDIGAGEFSPNKKYLKFGWDNYNKAYVEQDLKAKEIENKKWW